MRINIFSQPRKYFYPWLSRVQLQTRESVGIRGAIQQMHLCVCVCACVCICLKTASNICGRVKEDYKHFSVFPPPLVASVHIGNGKNHNTEEKLDGTANQCRIKSHALKDSNGAGMLEMATAFPEDLPAFANIKSVGQTYVSNSQDHF